MAGDVEQSSNLLLWLAMSCLLAQKQCYNGQLDELSISTQTMLYWRPRHNSLVSRVVDHTGLSLSFSGLDYIHRRTIQQLALLTCYELSLSTTSTLH